MSTVQSTTQTTISPMPIETGGQNLSYENRKILHEFFCDRRRRRYTHRMRRSAIPSETAKELQTIPGVGKSIAVDLWDLGIRRVADLSRGNPEQLYDKLCLLRGQHIDRCMLYVLRCAVYYASTAKHDPKKLLWWNWKD